MHLFLDDERFPPDDNNCWTIVRTVEEAIAYVQKHGCPNHISFDNDLGQGMKEGWEFAQWLIDYDLDTDTMPDNFSYYVHSQNTAAATNIRGKMDGYLAFKNNNT